jgi:hypothetical protein
MSRAGARRIASDGYAYTWLQYVEEYGVDAQRRWDDSYERSSYVEAYGDDARRCWDDAYDRDEARPRRGTCCLSGDSDASQLAVNANGEPQPAAANDEGTPQEDALLALLSVCTLQQVQEMQPMKGIGGKTAWAKQKELRQVCLQKEVFKIDVTETWPEWRAVLRALQPNRQQLIIGPGIAQVNFRLLEGVRDPNYAKLDSGERHVFEILRVDTSSVHLHYHKNGSFDEPTVHANSGASQSTVPSVAPSGSQPVIGRREAVLALTVLLDNCWNNEAGAVDITDGHGFDWKRFVANTEHLEIAAMKLEKVFALRTHYWDDMEDFGSPKLAFCTTGPTWKILDPTQASYKNTRLPGLRCMAADWRLEPLFLQAQTQGRNWMRMR